jgi:Mg2+ and Co2+ transporter CorA
LPAGTDLPQSASREDLLAAVEISLRELETLCGRLERSLMHRRWDEVETAIADSRRITHALQNAMDDAREVRDSSFDETVKRRLYYVHAIRQNQMERLQQYQDAVRERLRLMARWKTAIKTLAARANSASPASALDGLR